MKYVLFVLALICMSGIAHADLRAVSGGSAGGGISSVAEDTTPQLGGDLDTNGNDITGVGTDTRVCFSDTGAAVLNCDDADLTFTSTGTLNVGAGLDAVGAVDLDLGSADVTDVTATTDGGTVVLDGSVTASAGLVSTSGDLTVNSIQYTSGGYWYNPLDSEVNLSLPSGTTNQNVPLAWQGSTIRFTSGAATARVVFQASVWGSIDGSINVLDAVDGDTGGIFFISVGETGDVVKLIATDATPELREEGSMAYIRFRSASSGYDIEADIVGDLTQN